MGPEARQASGVGGGGSTTLHSTSVALQQHAQVDRLRDKNNTIFQIIRDIVLIITTTDLHCYLGPFFTLPTTKNAYSSIPEIRAS